MYGGFVPVGVIPLILYVSVAILAQAVLAQAVWIDVLGQTLTRAQLVLSWLKH